MLPLTPVQREVIRAAREGMGVAIGGRAALPRRVSSTSPRLLPDGWRYIGGPIPDAKKEAMKRPEWIMEHAEPGSRGGAGRPDQLRTPGHRW